MKNRFSPAAATVLLLTGTFAGGLRAATGPAGIPFDNNAQVPVTLSDTNPNKIVIDGELITSISGPAGAYDKQTTTDGALIISPLVGQDFTIFLQTDKDAAVSLNVHPRPGAGRTIRLTPQSLPVRQNPEARAWEEGQSYEKTLVDIARAATKGEVPDNFDVYPVSRITDYTPPVPVTLTPEQQFVGAHLRIVRYRMRNSGLVTQTLHEKDFWQKNVRAVMLSTRQLYASGEGYVWVIFSDDGVRH